MQHDDLTKNLVHPISTDLLLSPNLPRRVGRPSLKKWTPLFYSKAFMEEYKEITTELFELTNEEIIKYGTEVTTIRKHIKEEAEKVA